MEPEAVEEELLPGLDAGVQPDPPRRGQLEQPGAGRAVRVLATEGEEQDGGVDEDGLHRRASLASTDVA